MVLSVLWLGLALSGRAWAQTDADATRQALIQEAAAASQAGDHARAIDCARRALEIRASPSLHFLLAREELAVALPLEAHGHAAACIEGIRGAPAAANNDLLRGRCEALRDECQRSLALLSVRLPAPRPASLRVFIDGIPADLAQLDAPRARLPGAVEVVATADGAARFHERRAIGAGESATIALVLRPSPTVGAVVVEAPPPTPAPARLPALLPARPATRPTSYAGTWALGGVAVAGLVSMAVFGGLALTAQGERNARCATAESCDLAAASSADARYRDLAAGANVSLAVAGGFAVASLTWWLIARATRASSHATASALVLRW
ncbi:MAG: hypothetical protein U0325_13655 [Polyangiales bacterium]